jgi:AcrR family transcriptional regulator
VNRDEAKNILLLYRHGTADADDPQIAEALVLAKLDPELARWLEAHCARQLVLREKFRQITAPIGLKEQIISEQAAQQRMNYWRQKFALAAMAALVLLMAFAAFWLSPRGHDDTLAIYQNRMVGVALRGYTMDLLTNNSEPIRAYLAQNHAPADFVLPAALKKTALAGCAVEGWQGAKVSMICFRTGKPLAPGGQSDLWLFVVDRASVRGLPAGSLPQFSKVNRLITATWTEGDRLYLLGTEGDEQMLKQYL